MIFSKFFQQRKIQKLAAQFSELLERGEIKAALVFYDEYLSSVDIEISKALRAAYHFYRWFEYYQEQDLQSVELLALNAPADSQVVRAARTLRQFRRELNLASALQKRDINDLTAPIESADSLESKELHGLALAILETYHPDYEDQTHQVAKRVRNALSSANHLSERLREIYYTLVLWSNWNLQNYAAIFQNPHLLELLDKDTYQSFWLSALHTWGAFELSHAHIPAALAAIDKAKQRASAEQTQIMILDWGRQALEKGAFEAVVEWFSHPLVQQMVQGTLDISRLLILSLTYFQAQKYVLGRNTLDQLRTLQPDKAIQCQAQFLQSLSYLAEAQNWPRPQASDNRESSRERVMHNRTMWRALREKLQSIATDLSQTSTTLAWRGDLLAALVAYADSNTTLTADELDRFRAAIEHVDDEQGRARLKAIEGALTSRTKATEEAVVYVQSRDYAALRELQERVLSPLGDAIPALVRAAVYMTLWEGNPSYDPLPDLQRISLTTDNESIIGECILQVQATAALDRLRKACASPLCDITAVPSLGPLSFDVDVANLGALSIAVIQLHQDNWRDALEALPQIDGSGSQDFLEMLYYVQFYAAWQLGDIDLCTSVKKSTRFLKRYADWQPALDIRELLYALQSGQEDIRFIEQTSLADFPKQLTSIALWLYDHQESTSAMNLFNIVRRDVLSRPEISQMDLEHLNWILSFLTGLAAAQMGQYTTCNAAFTQVLAHLDTSTQDHQQLVGLAKLFKIQSELALVTQASDDIRVRWPSTRRSLAEQAEQLQETPVLQAYGFLIHGLVSYLTADVLVDSEMLNKLAHAQRVLPLSKHANFLQQVIAKLNWRRQVIAEFWGNLQRSNFKQSRTIYLEQIEPAFGDRVPYSIQLGMIIVDWDANVYTTTELVKRLTILEHEVPELDREFTQKTKDYIVNGDKIRRLTEFVEKKDFDATIIFVGENYPESMPVPVAIALLYAFYRKERMEDTERLAGIIRDNPGLAGWVRDYGFLVLGYVCFRRKDYQGAAEAFEKIRVSTLLGHDTDKYWAAAHFSRGLQLLEVDNKKEAFDAFRRSLVKRGASQENVNLTPLFMHFGLRNLESRDGGKALKSFDLIEGSLEGVSDDSQKVFKDRLLANLGQLLCRSLSRVDSKGEIATGDDFLALVDRLMKYKGLPDAERDQLERTCRIMAVSQELRKERMLDVSQYKTKAELHKYLAKQLSALKKLSEQMKIKDPVLLVIESAMELRLKGNPNTEKAIEIATKALNLGVQSPRLIKLLQEQQSKKKTALKDQNTMLDLFDLYLLQGDIPVQLKDSLIRHDDIAELYRINRNYTPKEVTALDVQSTAEIMEERLKHIRTLSNSDDFKTDGDITEWVQQLDEKVKAIKNLETEVHNLENNIVNKLAQRIPEQPLATSD